MRFAERTQNSCSKRQLVSSNMSVRPPAWTTVTRARPIFVNFIFAIHYEICRYGPILLKIVQKTDTLYKEIRTFMIPRRNWSL